MFLEHMTHPLTQRRVPCSLRYIVQQSSAPMLAKMHAITHSIYTLFYSFRNSTSHLTKNKREDHHTRFPKDTYTLSQCHGDLPEAENVSNGIP